MFNTNFIRKLNNDVLNAIFDTQIADLIERRRVQDAELFKECFCRATPKDGTVADNIINFSDYAAEAFREYHSLRAAQNADTGVEGCTEVTPSALYTVYMVSDGGVRQLLQSGFETEEDAEAFIDENNGCYVDENGFEWRLEVESTDAE